MFTVENLIRSATENEKKLILVVNELQEDYIIRLCESFEHQFYIVQSIMESNQWLYDKVPNNLKIVSSIDQIPRLDLIIATSRALSYEVCTNLSKMIHVPVLVLDSLTSECKVPHPIGTEVNIKNGETIFLRNGFVGVSYTEIIKESWETDAPRINFVIPPFMKIISNKGDKILIDPLLPQQYIENLPFNITEDRFTVDESEAGIYLHLWKHITPIMYDCMASEIPVVTFPLIDFKEMLDKKVLFTIEDFNLLKTNNFETQLLKASNFSSTIQEAKKYALQFKQIKFVNQWNNLFNHLNNVCYQRGIK